MDIYLPIAGLSVNALIIVALGALVGILSGMFGVGGGFLTTPLLIFYGIPPTVAVASASTQITGASVSGAMVHMRRGGVDLKMAAVLIAGGLCGSVIGAALFRILQSSGQIDVVINLLYVLILGGIGDAFGALAAGMVLGVVTEWSTLVIDSRWKVAVGFAVLVIVLIIRPQGIFGKAKTV